MLHVVSGGGGAFAAPPLPRMAQPAVRRVAATPILVVGQRATRVLALVVAGEDRRCLCVADAVADDALAVMAAFGA